MNDSIKACRICAQSEKSGMLEPIFGGNGERANDIFILSGIIEGPDTPALICKNCIISLSNAIQFRELCRDSERNFRSKTFEYEDTIFRQNLSFLCGGLVKQEESIVFIKNEPTDEFDDENELMDDFAAEDFVCRSIQHNEMEKNENVEASIQSQLRFNSSFTINGDKFACTIDQCGCNKEFKNVRSMRQHFDDFCNRASNKYYCEICGISFSRRPNLTRHINSVHIQETSHKVDNDRSDNGSYLQLNHLKEEIVTE